MNLEIFRDIGKDPPKNYVGVYYKPCTHLFLLKACTIDIVERDNKIDFSFEGSDGWIIDYLKEEFNSKKGKFFYPADSSPEDSNVVFTSYKWVGPLDPEYANAVNNALSITSIVDENRHYYTGWMVRDAIKVDSPEDVRRLDKEQEQWLKSLEETSKQAS